MNTLDVQAGDRVALAPHLDCWMRGIRYGRVLKVGRKYLHVAGETLYGKTVSVRVPMDAATVVPSAPWLH